MIPITDDMVKAAAFHTVPERLDTVLRDDDHLLEFYAQTRALMTKLQAQLEESNAAADCGRPPDPQWRLRIITIRKRVQFLLTELGPQVRALNIRQEAERQASYRETLMNGRST